jgi:hypothetical protein
MHSVSALGRVPIVGKGYYNLYWHFLLVDVYPQRQDTLYSRHIGQGVPSSDGGVMDTRVNRDLNPIAEVSLR